MNITIQRGRLGGDPKVNAEGKSTRAGFSLAVTDPFKKDENGNHKAEFFYWTAFGKTAELIANYLSVGDEVLVRGSEHNYKDANGVERTSHTVSEIEFIKVKKRSSAAQQTSGSSQTAAPATSGDEFMNIPDGVDDQELPFN